MANGSAERYTYSKLSFYALDAGDFEGAGRIYTGSTIEYGVIMVPIIDTDKVLPTGDDSFKIH